MLKEGQKVLIGYTGPHSNVIKILTGIIEENRDNDTVTIYVNKWGMSIIVNKSSFTSVTEEEYELHRHLEEL